VHVWFDVFAWTLIFISASLKSHPGMSNHIFSVGFEDPISAWAGVYVTQVFSGHQRTHLRTHSLQVVHICVCICIWIRICVYDIA